MPSKRVGVTIFSANYMEEIKTWLDRAKEERAQMINRIAQLETEKEDPVSSRSRAFEQAHSSLDLVLEHLDILEEATGDLSENVGGRITALAKRLEDLEKYTLEDYYIGRRVKTLEASYADLWRRMNALEANPPYTAIEQASEEAERPKRQIGVSSGKFQEDES